MREKQVREMNRASQLGRPVHPVKKALLQGVLSPEGDRIKLNPVISGGVYLGNDTSHESFADNFDRNRGDAFVLSSSTKWQMCHFVDRLSARSQTGPGRSLV